MTDKPMTLKEYDAKYAKRQEEERAWSTRSTNIKCEKCDGIYRYVDSFTAYASNPSQQDIKCDKCGDLRLIKV